MSDEDLEKFDAMKLAALVGKESPSDSCEICTKEKFKSWSDTTRDLGGNIKAIAEFEHAEEDIKKNGYDEFHPNGTNYWSSDAPIAIHFYPYNDCTINTCIACNAVFLRYIEYAGHTRQHRIRYVDKDLIVD